MSISSPNFNRRRSARLAAGRMATSPTSTTTHTSDLATLTMERTAEPRPLTVTIPPMHLMENRARKRVRFDFEGEVVEQPLTESPLTEFEDEEVFDTKLDSVDPPRISTKTRLRKRNRVAARLVESEMTTDMEEAPRCKKASRGKKRARGKTDSGDEFVEPEEPRTKQAQRPEPVYIIPDVEKKETTFRGRLGYACLNTVLRNKRPASKSVFCSRTCRLDSIKKNGPDWVKVLGRKNVEDLITMIQWNEDHHIRFLRVSSEMFPFASHKVHGYSLQFCDSLLAQAGELAHKYGHRLTTHPGQYTQLGSPKPDVIDSAVRELEYHCEMLDRMKVGVDGVMIVHGGGVYDAKAATLDRLKNTIVNVLRPHVRSRLVLENDELCYSAEDLLPLCEELDVPLVFDYHHDALKPSSIPPSVIIQRANAIWTRRGIRPKQHLSEPRPGAVTVMEKRAHADRCETLPPDLPDDIDLMIEAKDKEQAVFQLYRMYDLHPVIHASLRPPNPNPSKQTNGRKSKKRARATAGQEADKAGTEVELEDGELVEES